MALNRNNQDPADAAKAEIERYRSAYERDPASRVFAALSDAYRRAGQLQAAIQVARDGMQKHPRYVGGMVALGRALIEGEQIEEAKQQFENVVALSPDNLVAQRCLGDIHYKERNSEQALKAYQVILDLNPNDQEICTRVDQLKVTGTQQPQPAQPERVADDQTPSQTSPVIESKPTGSMDEFWDNSAMPSKTAQQQSAGVPLVAGEETTELQRPNIPATPGKDGTADPEASKLDLFFQGVDTDEQAESEDEASLDFQVKQAAEAIPGPVEQPAQDQDRSTITTETLAQLYLKQGFKNRALKIYKEILENYPDRDDMRAKVDQLVEELGQQPEGKPDSEKEPQAPGILDIEPEVQDTVGEGSEPQFPWEDEQSQEIDLPKQETQEQEQPVLESISQVDDSATQLPSTAEAIPEQPVQSVQQPEQVMTITTDSQEQEQRDPQQQDDLTPEDKKIQKLKGYLDKLKKRS